MKKVSFADAFLSWLPLGVAIVVLAGTAFLLVQQGLRQAANDPQIQVAHGVAQDLGRGADPSAMFPPGTVDVVTTFDPYLVVYASSGQPVAGTAQLGGKAPTVPVGVLKASEARGENRVTWEPKPGVRVAAVIVPYQGEGGTSYVLVGRSLKETEQRQQDALRLALIGMAIALVASWVLVYVAKAFGGGQPAEAMPQPMDHLGHHGT